MKKQLALVLLNALLLAVWQPAYSEKAGSGPELKTPSVKQGLNSGVRAGSGVAETGIGGGASPPSSPPPKPNKHGDKAPAEDVSREALTRGEKNLGPQPEPPETEKNGLKQ